MTQQKPQNFRQLSRLPRSGGTWQLGPCGIEPSIADGSRVATLLCVQGDGIVRAANAVASPATADDWARLAYSAMASPAPPQRPSLPAALRVRDDAAAGALRRLVAPLQIRVDSKGDFSSLDKAADRLGDALSSGGPVEIPDFDRELFAAAAAYARALPWTRISGEPEFVLKTRIKGWTDPVAVILGQMGETFGLVVYREDRFVPRDGLNDPQAGNRADSVVALLDDDPNPRTLQLARRNGYELQPQWLPTFIRVTPEREPVLIGAPDHARVLTLGLRAVVAWLERFDATGEIEEPIALFADQVVCRLGNPHVFGQSARTDAERKALVDAELRVLNDKTPLFGKDEALAPPSAPGASANERALAWHDLDRAVMERFIAKAPESMRVIIAQLLQNVAGSSEDEPSWSLPWLVHHSKIDSIGLTIGEWIEARLLDPRALAWFAANRQVTSTIWQVRRLEPGVGAELEDVFAPTHRAFVHDRGISTSTSLHDLLLARLVPIDGLTVVCGSNPNLLPPIHRQPLIDSVTAAVARMNPTHDPEIEGNASLRFVSMMLAWRKAVAAQSETRANLKLQNTDGDPMLMTRDRFAIVDGRADAVRAALQAFADAEPGEDDETIAFVREKRASSEGKRKGKGAAKRSGEGKGGANALAALEVVLIGRAIFHNGHLELETNSVQRADALRNRVLAACGDSVRFVVRSHEDPMSSAGGPMQAPANQPDIPHEVLAQMRAMRTEFMHRWLDDEVPALGGKTPRQAAKLPKLRAALIALVESIEATESRAEPDQRIDVSFLRVALGL